MSDVIFSGFDRAHLEVAVRAVLSYDRDHPDARAGISGARTYSEQVGGDTVRFYIYRKRTGALHAVCSAVHRSKR